MTDKEGRKEGREKLAPKLYSSIASFFNEEIATIPQEGSEEEKKEQILAAFTKQKEKIEKEKSKSIGHEKVFQILSKIQELQTSLPKIPQPKGNLEDIKKQISEVKEAQKLREKKVAFLLFLHQESIKSQTALIKDGEKTIKAMKKFQKKYPVLSTSKDLFLEAKTQQDIKTREEATNTLKGNQGFRDMIKSFRRMFGEIKEAEAKKSIVTCAAVNLETGETATPNGAHPNINELGFYFYLHNNQGELITLDWTKPIQIGEDFMINRLTEQEYNNNFNENGDEIFREELEKQLKEREQKKCQCEHEEVNINNQRKLFQIKIDNLWEDFFKNDKKSFFLDHILRIHGVRDRTRTSLVKAFNDHNGKLTKKQIRKAGVNWTPTFRPEIVGILQGYGVVQEA